MLLTGQEYLESIRDGRRVYVGSEHVDDVTTHPAFRNAARSFAMIYDRKRAVENRAMMTFEEDGETFSSYFLLPRNRHQRAYSVPIRARLVAGWQATSRRRLAHRRLGQFAGDSPLEEHGFELAVPPRTEGLREGTSGTMSVST